LYYDNSRQSSRFDFYTSYIGLDLEWHYNFTILFVPNTLNNRTFPMIYHIFPDEQGNNCTIRSSFIPNISPNWLQVLCFFRNHLPTLAHSLTLSLALAICR
jgi:hypothetical protein